MADKSLDKRTRQIDQTRVNKGNELEMMQKAQNQFLAIQAERKENLMQQRTIMGMEQQQNMALMEGAQIAASNNMGVPQTVDPRTQAVLSKYGLGRPRFQRTSQHSQQVTKQNVVIHNTTNNNTTNNIGGYGGPVQGRELAFRSPNNDSTEKFKIWLANSYARQQQQAVVRNREYEKREDNLIRSENKMMRKLEGLGKTMSKMLDPRTIGNTLVNPLKMLFIFMGFHLFMRNWRILMNTMRKVEGFLGGAAEHFGFGIKEGKVTLNKNKFSAEVEKKLGPLGTQVVKAFGGNPYRGDTVSDVLKRIIIGDKQNYGLWEQMKDYFSDKFLERSEAIKNFPAPDLGKYLKDKNFVGAIGELGGYLGNVLSIAFGGSKAIGRINMNEAYKRDYEEYDKNESFRQIFKGDEKTTSASTAERKSRVLNSLITNENMNKLMRQGTSYSAAPIEEFLGKDKLKIFRDLGLSPVSNESGGLFGGGRILKFRDTAGYEYGIGFNDNGSIMSRSSNTGHTISKFNVSRVGSPVTGDWYRGNLISYTDKSRKYISNVSLNSLNLTSDGKKLSDDSLSSFRQIKELESLVKNAKDTGWIDNSGFAIGMDRLRKYINSKNNGEYITTDLNSLKTVFKLSDSDINEARSKGLILIENFYTIKRKVSLMELLRLAHAKNPSIAGLEKAVNDYIYSSIPGTAFYDYFPANSVLGYYLIRNSSQKAVTNRAAEKIAKKGLKKGVESKVIERAQREAAKKIATKFASKGLTGAIPYVGWALMAWDCIDMVMTYVKDRNPLTGGLIDYEEAAKVIKDLPKWIGDVVSQQELALMIDADASAKSIERRCFDVHLVDSVTKKTLIPVDSEENLNRAKILIATIDVTYFKSLFETAGLGNSVNNLEDLITQEEINEGAALDFAHKSSDYLNRTLLNSGDYSSAGEDSFWSKSWTGENSGLYKLEVANKANRDRKRQDKEDAKTQARSQVEQDSKMANSLGLHGVLPNSSQAAKIAYLKNELYKNGIIDPDDQNAIIGNLMSESPGLNEKAQQPDGSGEGIAQWTNKAWKEAVLKHINDKRKERGLEPVKSIKDASFEEQVSALLYTPDYGILLNKGHGHRSLVAMQSVEGIGPKTVKWMDEFERPVYSLSHNSGDNSGSKAWNWKYENNKRTNEKVFYNRSRNEELASRIKNARISGNVNSDGNSLITDVLTGAASIAVDGTNLVIDAGRKIANSDAANTIKGAFKDKLDETKAKVLSNIPKTTHSTISLDSIGREYNDYNYYINNPGSLTPGLTNYQWQEEVRRKTGFYPAALTDITDRLYLPKGGKIDGVNQLKYNHFTTEIDDQGVNNLFRLANMKNTQANKELEAKKKEEEKLNREIANNKNIASLAVNQRKMNGILIALGDVIRGSHDWRKNELNS